MPSEARRTGRPRQHDLPELWILRPLDPLPEREEFGERARRVPLPEIASAPAGLAASLAIGEPDDVGEQLGGVVDTCLRAHEEAIESRDVTAGRARAESVRLDERRPGTGERIPDELAG
jgi:hypothetical protein